VSLAREVKRLSPLHGLILGSYSIAATEASGGCVNRDVRRWRRFRTADNFPESSKTRVTLVGSAVLIALGAVSWSSRYSRARNAVASSKGAKALDTRKESYPTTNDTRIGRSTEI